MQAQYTFINWYRRSWLSNYFQTGDSPDKNVNIKPSISIVCQEERERFLWYAIHKVQSQPSLLVTIFTSCYSFPLVEIPALLTDTVNARNWTCSGHFIPKPTGISPWIKPIFFHFVNMTFVIYSKKFYLMLSRNSVSDEISSNRSSRYPLSICHWMPSSLKNDWKPKGSQVSAADIGAFGPHLLILKSLIGNSRRCEATGCLKKVAGGKSLSPGLRNGCNLWKKNTHTHTEWDWGKEGERDHDVLVAFSSLLRSHICPDVWGYASSPFPSNKISSSRLLPSSSSRLSLALERPGRWFSDLHGDICVQRVPLDLNHSVGQRADAVLLHRVLRVLYFIESGGWQTKRLRERGGRGKMERHGRKVIRNNAAKSIKKNPVRVRVGFQMCLITRARRCLGYFTCKLCFRKYRKLWDWLWTWVLLDCFTFERIAPCKTQKLNMEKKGLQTLRSKASMKWQKLRILCLGMPASIMMSNRALYRKHYLQDSVHLTWLWTCLQLGTSNLCHIWYNNSVIHMKNTKIKGRI